MCRELCNYRTLFRNASGNYNYSFKLHAIWINHFLCRCSFYFAFFFSVFCVLLLCGAMATDRWIRPIGFDKCTICVMAAKMNWNRFVLFVEHFQRNEKSNPGWFFHLLALLALRFVNWNTKLFFSSVRLKDFAVGHIITSYFRLQLAALKPENPQNKQIGRIQPAQKAETRKQKAESKNERKRNRAFYFRFRFAGFNHATNSIRIAKKTLSESDRMQWKLFKRLNLN